MPSDSPVLGVVVLIRHGDRQGFYQDPTTYTASSTAITALGAQQEFALGQALRTLYLNASSPAYIRDISTGPFQQAQVAIAADAGGEGGVIYDSAVALTQGLWPATTLFNTSLANGTVVSSPLGGYQYIPVAAVNPNNDISLEGWNDCSTFNNYTTAFYSSAAFAAKQKEAEPFLNSLAPYLDGRNVSLTNMWNIYDYMNVNNIHNATFARSIPAGYMEQARALANWHEYNVFSDANVTGVGNIAGRTVLPSILNGLQGFANGSAVKLVVNAMAYKPFISLFNMAGVAQQYPELAGIVEYASAVALEVRAGSPPTVHLSFKNGTAPFTPYGLLGHDNTSDVPLPELLRALQPAAINGTADWCRACGNTADRGCAAYYSTALRPAPAPAHRGISAAGAGAVGAAVTLAVVALALAVLALLGFLTFGKKGVRPAGRIAPRRSQSSYRGEEDEGIDLKQRG